MRKITFYLQDDLFALLERDIDRRNKRMGYDRESQSTVLRSIIAKHYLKKEKKARKS